MTKLCDRVLFGINGVEIDLKNFKAGLPELFRVKQGTGAEMVVRDAMLQRRNVIFHKWMSVCSADHVEFVTSQQLDPTVRIGAFENLSPVWPAQIKTGCRNFADGPTGADQTSATERQLRLLMAKEMVRRREVEQARDRLMNKIATEMATEMTTEMALEMTARKASEMAVEVASEIPWVAKVPLMVCV
ncbi:hypothetical protein FOZ61_006993 [Perkinsus olseni]|uniref:Uncharacterized protein n=1 Tax=Perkinsus olseni TaxID=32597 RepID=A0A7J6MB14_PEROL|nr:hypothetical protein FOL46_005644 [Perkinsus olseni]KAF4668191.1 hypothetical protein FOZ61_006993 [Perkinsus olseni]